MGGAITTANLISDSTNSKPSYDFENHNTEISEIKKQSESSNFPDTKGPCLRFSRTIGFKEVYNDRGTGAKLDGSIWKPIPPENFYVLGFVAKNDYQTPEPCICVADALEGSPYNHSAALAVPIRFERVWSNEGAWFLNDKDNGRELAIYKPVPPIGYVSVGYVCICSLKQIPKPTDAMFNTVRCVHESLVGYGRLDRLAWQSKGTSPKVEMSLWNLSTDMITDSVQQDSQVPIMAWVSIGTFQIRCDLERSRDMSDSATGFLAEPPPNLFSGNNTTGSNSDGKDNTSHVAGKWTEVRCFISSTFVDQHGERDILVKTVFPELNERLRRENRWVRLVPIDLRWGVLPEQTKRIQQTCLNELDSCLSPRDIELQALSSMLNVPINQLESSLPSHYIGRPWVVALRGERYGWIQDTYAPTDDFARSDRVRLWIEYLQKEHKKISITSMEVCHSILSFSSLALNNKEISNDQSNNIDNNDDYILKNTENSLIHAFAYFRDPGLKEKLPADLKWVFDFDYISKEDQENLPTELKLQYAPLDNFDEVMHDLNEVNELLKRAKDVCISRDYIVENATVKITGSLPNGKKFATGTCEGLQSFRHMTYDDLYQSVCAEYPIIDVSPDASIVQRIMHEAVVDSRTTLFFGRKELIKQLQDFCTGNIEYKALVVWGDAGCGKSALIAKFYLEVKQYFKSTSNSFVWIHAVSATPESFRVKDVLYRLCTDLVKRYGLLITVNDDLSILRFQLLYILKEASRKIQNDKDSRIVIILDAINQMSPDGGAFTLSWLPLNDLPPSVRVLMTTLPHKVLYNARLLNEHDRPLEIQVPIMDKESRKELVRGYLGQFNKRLSEDDSDFLLKNQMEILLNKPEGGSPLFLMAACEILLTFGGAYELMTEFITNLAGTIPLLFEQLIGLLEIDHGYDLVKRALSLVACSPSGLLELDMIELMDESNSSDEATSNFSRLYSQTKLFLGGNGSGLMQFFHNELLFVVRRKYGLDPPLISNDSFCSINNILGTHFAKKILRRDCSSFERAAEVYIYHSIRSPRNQWLLVVNILTSLSYLQLMCELHLIPILMRDILDAIEVFSQPHIDLWPHEIAVKSCNQLKEFMTFIRRRMAILSISPTLTLQVTKHYV